RRGNHLVSPIQSCLHFGVAHRSRRVAVNPAVQHRFAKADCYLTLGSWLWGQEQIAEGDPSEVQQVLALRQIDDGHRALLDEPHRSSSGSQANTHDNRKKTRPDQLQASVLLAPVVVCLLGDPHLPARRRSRLHLRYRHFNLPHNVYDLLRRVPLDVPHSLLLPYRLSHSLWSRIGQAI